MVQLAAVCVGFFLMFRAWLWIHTRVRARLVPRMLAKKATSKPRPVRFQLRIGRGLEPLCGFPGSPGGRIEGQLQAELERFLQNRGLPALACSHVMVDPLLDSFVYEYDFGAISVGGELEPGSSLACIGPTQLCPDWLLERRVMHPVLDLEAAWIGTEELPRAWMHGLQTESCLELLFHHFRWGMAAHIDQVYQLAPRAPWHAMLPERAQALFNTHGKCAGEALRSAIRQGASLTDSDAFFSTMAYGLRSGKSPSQVGEMLAERYPVGGDEPVSEDVRLAAACYLFGQLSQQDWLKIEQIPGGAVAVADILLRARSLPRWQKLQALQQIHCLKRIFGDRHGIAELFKDPPLQASEPQKLAALLLALPQEPGQSLLVHLQRTLPTRPFEEMAEWMARWSHLVEVGFAEGWSPEAEDLLLREPVEDFLRFVTRGASEIPLPSAASGSPPSGPRASSPGMEEADEEAYFVYQLEARHWPVLHWKARLDERARSLSQLHKDVHDWWRLDVVPAQTSEQQIQRLLERLSPLQQVRIRRELGQRGCVLAHFEPMSPSRAVVAAEKFLTP